MATIKLKLKIIHGQYSALPLTLTIPAPFTYHILVEKYVGPSFAKSIVYLAYSRSYCYVISTIYIPT